ncbi:hypothetical protein FOZ60_009027 [Perkinsus olseni]|nr:hypothetical protein FOZ60_009027 [Perkinsus olseni]
MDPAAYPTGVTAPQNSTTTVLSPEQHWYILADHLVGDVSHWLDDQNQIVLSIAVCFIGLWIMVLGEKTLQLAWLAAGVVSGFYLWYLPVTEWYLPSLATPEAFRIITAVVCGGLGGWIAYLFRLGALFIVNLLFIAPLTFLILTAFIDLSPSQDWLQIRLVLSLLFGTIVSAGVVKGRKIGLRVICVLSGTFLVATTAGFLAEEIEEKNYEDSQPILWRGCVGSCLVDAPEVLSNPSDADVSCLTFFMVWTVLAISTLIFQFITQTSICCAAKNRAEQRVQNSTTLSRPLLSSRTPQQRRSSKPKWVPQCCVEF